MSPEPGTNDAVARATRRIAAPAERIFDAWLDPALVGRWMFRPGRDEVLGVAIDARPGGRFSFRVRRGDDEIDHVGEYTAIERPRRLAFTWGIAGEEGSDGVEVLIAPLDDGRACDVTVLHRMHPDWSDFAPKAAEAWASMLDGLGALLASHPEREREETRR